MRTRQVNHFSPIQSKAVRKQAGDILTSERQTIAQTFTPIQKRPAKGWKPKQRLDRFA